MAEHSAVVENIALVMERTRETTMSEIKTLCAGEILKLTVILMKHIKY